MRLVGDIGGTNARFARSGAKGEYRNERKFAVADHPEFLQAVRAYLAEGPPVDEAVIAVATPVRGDKIQFTNNPWHFSIAEMKRVLGLQHLSVINDFVAQAEAIPALHGEDLRELKPGVPRPDRPILVIGPGTGLGAAFMLPGGTDRRVLPSEAGHASFASQDAVQDSLLARLRQRHGHVSIERLLSGPGLLSIAMLIAEAGGESLDIGTPREVSARAAEGICLHCAEALRIFSSILGSVAGNLALTMRAEGGVFLTGGLCRGLGPLLDTEALTAAFADKGRFSGYLAQIRIDQVLRPHTGLLGAAVYRHAGMNGCDEGDCGASADKA
jgi:glucokinase